MLTGLIHILSARKQGGRMGGQGKPPLACPLMTSTLFSWELDRHHIKTTSIHVLKPPSYLSAFEHEKTSHCSLNPEFGASLQLFQLILFVAMNSDLLFVADDRAICLFALQQLSNIVE